MPHIGILVRSEQTDMYHLAQLNIATLRAPLDSPPLKDFVDNLDRINQLAEQSDGFVWRLKDEHGDATQIRPFGENVVVNLSVWRDLDALKHYAFKTAHADMLRRRREWFERMESAYLVLWWIPAGHRPDVQEAAVRLAHLQAHGASEHAFTFRETFPFSQLSP